MKKAILILIVFILAAINVGEQPTQPVNFTDFAQSNNSIKFNALGTVVHDGVISVNEYEYTISPFVDKNGILMDLHYTINRSVIYIAFTANVGGWISIGFDYSKDMQDSDMIVGWHNELTGTTIVSDKWGDSPKGMPGSDLQQDILSYAGSQITSPSNKTIIEFSRYLDTGDILQDKEIIPGVGIKIVWATHDDADMYTPDTEHTDEGKFRDPDTESRFFTFYGSPSTPKNLTVNSETENQVGLNWIASAGDGGFAINSYNIYRSMYNRGTTSWDNYVLIDSTTSTNNYIDSTITSGENYTYKITAENIKGESGFSNEVDAFPYGVLTQPRNLMTVASNWQVDLTWDYPASDGGVSVDQYYVLKSETSGSNYEVIGQTNQMTFDDTDVINGFDYFYLVYAQNRLSSSAISVEVIGQPIGDPSPPTNLAAFHGNNNVTLNWEVPITDGGYNIIEYNIYRSDLINGTYEFISANSQTSYLDNDVINANTYYYRITARNSFGESELTSIQQVTIANVPTTVSEITPTTYGENITLGWTNANGMGYDITEYYIYRSTIINGKYVVVGNTAGNSFVDISIIKGTTYYYKVTAWNEVGEGSYSSIVFGTPSTVPTAPVNLQTFVGLDRIKLIWDEVEDNGGFIVSHYLVYRSSGSDYDLLSLTYPKEYVDKDILIDIIYTYKIIAVNRIGESEFSEIASVGIQSPPEIPSTLTAEITQEGIVLSWEPLDNTTEINLYRSTVSGEPYSLATTTSEDMFLDINILFGNTYYYVITHTNSNGESEFSAEIEVTPVLPPSEPQNLVGLAGNKQTVLIWETPEFDGGIVIEYYNIYRSDSIDGEYVIVSSTTTVMYIDQEVENNNTYYYSISAVTFMGESELTEVVSIEPNSNGMEFEFVTIIEPNTNSDDQISSTTDPDVTELETEQLQEGVIIWTSSVIISSIAGIAIINVIGNRMIKP